MLRNSKSKITSQQVMLVSVFHHKAMRMSKVPVKKKHKLLFLELLPHGGEQTARSGELGREDKK